MLRRDAGVDAGVYDRDVIRRQRAIAATKRTTALFVASHPDFRSVVKAGASSASAERPFQLGITAMLPRPFEIASQSGRAGNWREALHIALALVTEPGFKRAVVRPEGGTAKGLAKLYFCTPAGAQDVCEEALRGLGAAA